ncbi:MAG TPA: hypothetical protein VFA67_16805 [Candidatus Sulfotelmatobacter sp.]|nr:hypothetical protein [Candidatus Sulfotelmatobacter sp.]
MIKRFLLWSSVLLAALIPPVAAGQRAEPRAAAACGPPEYCAATDREVKPYPDKPPALGPAGSIIRDPTFGSRILRVTDGASDPTRADRPLFTPASAEQNSWNTDSTAFYVNTAGGSFLIYTFDPATMKAKSAGNPNADMGGEPVFSFQKPNILYGMARKRRIIEQYDIAKGRMTDLDDPSKCLKLQLEDSGFLSSISADDNRFLAILGPQQDKNYAVYVYDRTQGCRWYNTQTGEIGGQWGPKGTISIPDRFSLHNARMAKSGKFVYMTRGGGPGIGRGWVVWEVDTMKLYVCRKGCPAHHVLGHSHIIGPSGELHPLDTWVRPLNDLDATKPIVPDLPRANGFWFDSHFSWNNVDPNDSAPVCFSTYRPNNPDTPATAPLVTGPWQNEIDCAQMDGKGSRIWRFAHTYSTARNGFWSTPRGNVSQDGRFFMFTSDWEDQLGKTPAGKYRTDVFIVELR